jgi:LacI family transcriptional regulator
VSATSATLVDIARETGTSISTVSRVLAGGPGSARISDATRQRVVEVANRLGYRPNLVARSLRTRRSHTIALMVSDIANPWFGQIASLVEQSLYRHGYSLMLCNSEEDPQLENEYLRLLPSKGIDGLILVPMIRDGGALRQMLPANLPLVILDRPVAGIDASVSSDQDQSSHLLCDVLEEAGVRRVALVAGPDHISTHKHRAQVVRSRFEVMAEHQGPARKETGRRAFIQFLQDQPDAIVCTNNFLGHGVIDAIANIDQPPIIGCFDEIPMMHLLPIPIACSIQDVAGLADGCVIQLLPQLQGQPGRIKPIVLHARSVTNREFQVRRYEAADAGLES